MGETAYKGIHCPACKSEISPDARPWPLASAYRYCPACKSEISPDGVKLYKKSEKLKDLEDSMEIIPKLEAQIEKMAKEKAAAPVSVAAPAKPARTRKPKAAAPETNPVSGKEDKPDGAPKRRWFQRGR